MKCVKCQQDATYKDRPDGKCPKCGQRFVFEPKNKDLFTDAAFAGAIDRVSSHGAVRWTPHHLYYELNRSLLAKAKKVSVVGYAIPLIFLTGGIVLAWSRNAHVLVIIFGLLSLLLSASLISDLRKAKQSVAFLLFNDFFPLWKR